MTVNTTSDKLLELKLRILNHLEILYPDDNTGTITENIVNCMNFETYIAEVKYHCNLWDEKDIITITYGDSIINDDELPLTTLHGFLDDYIRGISNIIHILPFFPYSSDDGFSIINYSEVNQSLGDWSDISSIGSHYSLMADLVINHCSSRSVWFDNFKQNKHPGADYFIECDADTDVTKVVRPRTSPLLRKTETLSGTKYVWCTFSHDQIDLNFKNPDVLIAFIKIIKLYIDYGVRVFRLDAVAFLWKQADSSCINLTETHEVIRLLRLIIEHYAPNTIIITETNIPNRENLSYFGNANEAHLIYNFSLPPLLLYTMLSGSSRLLKQWMMSMPPAQNGTSYYNFIASHDGIGLRPVEGILSDKEISNLTDTIQHFGGEVSWRTISNGDQKPYELNITLLDAMKGTFEGEDQYQIERFVCTHAIMLALEGIPAFYIHSLLATQNDYKKMDLSSNKRAINRHNWDYSGLIEILEDENTINHRIFSNLKNIISIRKDQKAFHPNATQFTLHLDESLFAFWRQSQDRQQSIFCIHNISNKDCSIALRDINMIELDNWRDLISGYKYLDYRETISLKPYEFVWITNR